MQYEFLLAGFGGQGVMFAGQLLAYTAMSDGWEVSWIPSYGPEMRGGTAHCYVIMSDEPIGSPIIKYPKVVIVFNKPSFDKYEPMVAPKGILACNASLIDQESQRTDITKLSIPATILADELGDARLANVMMLSAVLTILPVLPLESLKHALEEHIPPHRRELLPLNCRAIEQGATFAARSIVTRERTRL